MAGVDVTSCIQFAGTSTSVLYTAFFLNLLTILKVTFLWTSHYNMSKREKSRNKEKKHFIYLFVCYLIHLLIISDCRTFIKPVFKMNIFLDH